MFCFHFTFFRNIQAIDWKTVELRLSVIARQEFGYAYLLHLERN